jgi:hypothetical protein
MEHLRMRKLIAAASLLVCTAGAARAQQTTPAAPSAAPATADTIVHTTDPARIAAAHELVDALNVQKVLDRSMENMLRMQTEQNPAMMQFADIMRAFFARYVTWNALRDSYAQIYADLFSASDLRELVAFYRSPIGRRLADATPELTERGSNLGREAVQAHLPELQAQIMARLQQNMPAPPATPNPPKP